MLRIDNALNIMSLVEIDICIVRNILHNWDIAKFYPFQYPICFLFGECSTKHESWLNIAEIEINVMDKECLARRRGEAEKFEKEIKCWSRKRNESKKKIHWSFKRQDADHKLSKHYVS